MNLLAARIREGALEVPVAETALDPLEGTAVYTNVVTGPSLVSFLLAAEPALLEGVDDDFVLALLGNAYLSLMPPFAWEEALQRAGGVLEDEAVPPGAEWVTFAQAPGTPVGVLLPQDGSPQPRLSMFIRLADRVRSLSFERDDGEGLRISVRAAAGHCGLPDEQGLCDPGTCGGCLARVREVGEWGLVCWCGH